MVNEGVLGFKSKKAFDEHVLENEKLKSPL